LKRVPLVGELVPDAFPIHVPGAGPFENRPQFRCLEEGAIDGVEPVASAPRGPGRRAGQAGDRRRTACAVGSSSCETPPLPSTPGSLGHAIRRRRLPRIVVRRIIAVM
jgi:hypothetical protein